jgi:hypothetical protein
MIKGSALLMVSTMIKYLTGMEGEFLLNSSDIHAGQCTPDTATGSQDGLVEVRL